MMGGLIANLFLVIFGMGWFTYHLRRFSKWQAKRTNAPIRYQLIAVYSVGCMAFGIAAAILGATSSLQGR